ncbi:hypothetical protein BJ875DRAFT_526276 [Amylocarpus encephaloides]|uniref:Uncharacterized protein n=1 Tax=Amylocarpus encephaloides TaxID=45428 RepID=A0A9P8C8P4_9HELO|nr:hypothetical protein BJ875DRAFT_526276 [Amylocarpus encephaloides]
MASASHAFAFNQPHLSTRFPWSPDFSLLPASYVLPQPRWAAARMAWQLGGGGDRSWCRASFAGVRGPVTVPSYAINQSDESIVQYSTVLVPPYSVLRASYCTVLYRTFESVRIRGVDNATRRAGKSSRGGRGARRQGRRIRTQETGRCGGRDQMEGGLGAMTMMRGRLAFQVGLGSGVGGRGRGWGGGSALGSARAEGVDGCEHRIGGSQTQQRLETDPFAASSDSSGSAGDDECTERRMNPRSALGQATLQWHIRGRGGFRDKRVMMPPVELARDTRRQPHRGGGRRETTTDGIINSESPPRTSMALAKAPMRASAALLPTGVRPIQKRGRTGRQDEVEVEGPARPMRVRHGGSRTPAARLLHQSGEAKRDRASRTARRGTINLAVIWSGPHASRAPCPERERERERESRTPEERGADQTQTQTPFIGPRQHFTTATAATTRKGIGSARDCCAALRCAAMLRWSKCCPNPGREQHDMTGNRNLRRAGRSACRTNLALQHVD